MNFSESFPSSRGLVAFSPDGCYLASCIQHRLVVRDASSLQILHLHTCLEPVQQVLWSPDSLFLLTAMFKRGIVQVSASIRHLLARALVLVPCRCACRYGLLSSRPGHARLTAVWRGLRGAGGPRTAVTY